MMMLGEALSQAKRVREIDHGWHFFIHVPGSEIDKRGLGNVDGKL